MVYISGNELGRVCPQEWNISPLRACVSPEPQPQSGFQTSAPRGLALLLLPKGPPGPKGDRRGCPGQGAALRHAHYPVIVTPRVYLPAGGEEEDGGA